MRINRLVPVIMLLMVGSCSRPVIRQPISEIDRPLFLPPSNWQFSSGVLVIQYLYPGYDNIRPDLDWSLWFDFQFPSFRFGNYVEYQIPAALRFYLIRNSTIVDSTECISGLNLVLSSSLTGFSYSQRDGLRVPTAHRLLLKCPLSKHSWFESGLTFNIELPVGVSYVDDHGWDLELPLIIGFQPTKQVSITAGAVLEEAFWYRAFHTGNPGWDYESRYYNLDLVFPATVRYAFNRNWDLTLRGQCTVFDRRYLNLIGGMIGSFTW
jgi:hypothetical protein